MSVSIDDMFIALSVQETRCPEKVQALAPSARKIYILKERFDCSHWRHMKDCFHEVKGAYIVNEPAAGRKYFTTKPKQVIARLQNAGVW